MTLMRYEPFRELEAVSNRLNRLLGMDLKPGIRPEGVFADWEPAMDVQETENEYLIKTDLPDVKKEDVRITVENGVLAVEGERRMEKEEKGKKFHRIERSYGRFVRQLAVPTDVDQQHVEASFKDGVLNVRLPKSATAKPRRVDVTVA
jgi:HSP20 family protein